jgi:hypothetical protein
MERGSGSRLRQERSPSGSLFWKSPMPVRSGQARPAALQSDFANHGQRLFVTKSFSHRRPKTVVTAGASEAGTSPGSNPITILKWTFSLSHCYGVCHKCCSQIRASILVDSALIATLHTQNHFHEGGRPFHFDWRNSPWISRAEDADV